MIDQETRDLALQTFKDVLTAPDAKPADRLRAAEGVMKLQQDAKDKGMGDILDADDEELLKKAREGASKSENGAAEDDNPAS